MKRYDVTFVMQRKVCITVDVPNGEDVAQWAWDNITVNNGEEMIDVDYYEVDPNEH
jgi:hypothetical protein